MRQLISFTAIATVIWASVFACFPSSVLAQPNISYRVHWPNIPSDWSVIWVNKIVIQTDIDRRPLEVLVVGNYRRPDRTYSSAFVYDHFGLIDPDSTYADPDPNNPNDPIPNRFWDIEELVGPLPSPWAWSSLVGVNSTGRMCGRLRSAVGQISSAFYLDLTDPVLTLHTIPVPSFVPPTDYYIGSGVNEGGDVLVSSGITGDIGDINDYFIHNPLTEENIEIPIAGQYGYSMNSSRQIVGRTSNDVLFRYDANHGETELFPDLQNLSGSQYEGILDSGQFVSVLEIRKGRDKGFHTVRIGADGFEERRLWKDPGIIHAGINDLNSSGDAIDQTSGDARYYYEGMPWEGDEFVLPSIDTLIQPESDPDFAFRGSTVDVPNLSDRDSTDFGWIAGRSFQGENSDGSNLFRLYVLIPEIPGQTPGVSVSPTSGLTTTESGGTDTFDVVLDTQPTADVTIDVSSLDTTEGTINGSTNNSLTLTFTTTDWLVEQTVTVKGVQDLATDGDIDYEITATATGGDYEGLTALVTATNRDDEVSNLTLTVDDPSVTEGNRKDKTPGEFTITLSATSVTDVQVWYQVSNGSAGNKDYRMVDSASDLLTFAPGDTSKTVRFNVLGDTRRESDETFSIELTNPILATISKGIGTATIIDND